MTNLVRPDDPDHVDPIAAPRTEDGLTRAIGEAHPRYSRTVNFRQGWRGFLGARVPDRDAGLLRRHERTGRPLDSPALAARPEELLNRALRPRKRGRKPKARSPPGVGTNTRPKYV